MSQTENKLTTMGVNTSGILKVYNLFKQYIHYPTFSEVVNGTSKYTTLQFETLRSLLFETSSLEQSTNNIKSTILYLIGEGFESYSWTKFENYAVAKLREDNVPTIDQPVYGNNEPRRLPFCPRSLESMYEEGIPEVEWYIHNILPKRGITFFGGTSGSYKTWAGMHLALTLSLGEDFLFKFPTLKSKVLYLDEENGDISLFKRFQMLTNGYNLKRPFDNLHVVNFSGMKLDLQDHMEILDNYIEEHDIKVVVVDSMVRCMHGQEDKSTDVRLIFDNLKGLLEKRRELSIVILHHTRKGGKGMDALRGSGDFAAFADIILMFDTTHKNHIVEVEVAKHRHVDLAEFNKFAFEINKVNDGKGLTLAVTDNTVGAWVSIVEDCANSILDYAKEKGLSGFKSGATSELFKEMEKMEFTKYHCYDALKLLTKEGLIEAEGRGKWRVILKQSQLTEKVY